ncbi:MAG: hypothetical protein R2698_03175 [Microthrixaceae bacterium]
MHDDRSIVEARLRRVLAERLRPAEVLDRLPLAVGRFELDGEPETAESVLARATFEPFAIGGAYGRPWATTWFEFTGSVPASWAGGRVEAHVDLGFSDQTGFQSEGLLWEWSADAPFPRPTRGLHPRHQWVLVDDPGVGGGPSATWWRPRRTRRSRRTVPTPTETDAPPGRTRSTDSRRPTSSWSTPESEHSSPTSRCSSR